MELMKERWLVIADYPKNTFEAGTIIVAAEDNEMYSVEHGYSPTDRIVWLNDMDKYPHLFKRLQWYERREIGEMPAYVKMVTESIAISNREGWDYQLFMKVKRWDEACSDHPLLAVIDNDSPNELRMVVTHFEPSTKEEFESYTAKTAKDEK